MLRLYLNICLKMNLDKKVMKTRKPLAYSYKYTFNIS